MRTARRIDGYLPLAQYGVIGDCRSLAMVGCDGSIDWLCLPRFDDPSIFARLLDDRKGGFWQLVPRAPYQVMQRYRDRSNILETVFTTGSGRIIVTDFMPIEHAHIGEHARPHADVRLVRMVDCVAGEVTLTHRLRPRPGYGLSDAVFAHQDHRYHGDADGLHLCVRCSAPFDGPEGVLSLACGQRASFGLISNRAGQCPKRPWTMARAQRLLDVTRDYWWRWAAELRYSGPYQQPVTRSALALKLMTYSPTGAIVAAPTTSLPERIGGGRNWDYRFTWLRDASFTLYAFFQLGLVEEATDFFGWLSHTGIGDEGERLDNLYDLSGHHSTQERMLSHLEGYRKSRPVRIGNAAAHQLQLDVYGEVLDSAYVFARFGGRINRGLWRGLHTIVDLAIANWQLDDASIWEVRGQNLPFTYSKLMCWVAVDRGLRIAERFRLPHEGARWRRARTQIRQAILRQAWSSKRQAFAQSFGSDVLDAAILRMSQTRFLSGRDPRLASTISAIAKDLGEGALVSRYRVNEHDDGVGGGEGAFLMCSFWLCDALAHMGELEAAQQRFEHMLTFGSPLGLFGEECDQSTGEALGNFPQAFTHLSLVGAAVNIERARHRLLGPKGLHRPPTTLPARVGRRR